MYFKRYPVPTGKEIIIGHDYGNGCDVIGFVEPSDCKLVKLADSLYENCARKTCSNCELHFKHYIYRNKYEETYQNLFLVHPDMCIDILNELGFLRVMNGFYSRDVRQNPWYTYAKKGIITIEYFIQGLLKWNDYEDFVKNLVRSSVFDEILIKAVSFVYQQYNKCKGFTLEGLCKKGLDVFKAKKVPCNHNTILFLQSLSNTETYYLYDRYHEASLSLPNVYRDGEVCWGNARRPTNLSEAYFTWWSAPFNGDLLHDTYSDSSELIEGYGFDPCDFYPYDEDIDETDYDEDPRPFTTDEIITIIKRGGNNEYKGSIDLTDVEFDVEGVREILVVEDGRQIPDFAEIINDNFLFMLQNCENLFIFLINELEKDVWQAYVPTDNNEGVYIQINLRDLANLNLDDDTDTEETEDDDDY